MEKALFIARSPYGKEVLSMEIPLARNIFDIAHDVMEVAKKNFPDILVYCCEVWTRTDYYNMYLLVTVF